MNLGVLRHTGWSSSHTVSSGSFWQQPDEEVHVWLRFVFSKTGRKRGRDDSRTDRDDSRSDVTITPVTVVVMVIMMCVVIVLTFYFYDYVGESSVGTANVLERRFYLYCLFTPKCSVCAHVIVTISNSAMNTYTAGYVLDCLYMYPIAMSFVGRLRYIYYPHCF